MLRKWLLKFAPKVLYRPCLTWWLTWSHIYRELVQGEYDAVIPIKPLAEVVESMKLLTWTADGPTELWDACGSPGWVQHCLNYLRNGYKQPEGSLDCDDFAVWAANSLSKEHNPRLLSVVWVTKDNKIAGHVVCLCNSAKRDSVFHIGNWGTSRLFDDLHDACTDMVTRAQGEKLIGWCILDKNLKLHKYGTELPEAGYDGSLR
jgi:hypothetical protein